MAKPCGSRRHRRSCRAKTAKTGENGKTPEFRVNENKLEWRYIGDTVWHDIYDLSVLKGTDGRDGTNGKDGADGKDGQREPTAKTASTEKTERTARARILCRKRYGLRLGNPSFHREKIRRKFNFL